MFTELVSAMYIILKQFPETKRSLFYYSLTVMALCRTSPFHPGIRLQTLFDQKQLFYNLKAIN